MNQDNPNNKNNSSSLPQPDETYWRRKLSAFLHDTPSKCLDIYNHGEFSHEAFVRAGLLNQSDQKPVKKDYSKADQTAAAADRLPWPHPKPASMQSTFDGERNRFTHPLTGNLKDAYSEPIASKIPFEPFKSTEQSLEGEASTQPLIESFPDHYGEADQWKARFFAHWRLWPKHAEEKDYRYRLLPAETRLPDHTIWNHMQIVSALSGCMEEDATKPAFFRFQIGGVQSFISEARSTRDLWSGSYLLSWLMATALKAITEYIGPDAVIFPSLRGQPIFDLLWSKELWSQVKMEKGAKNCWHSLEPDPKELSIPNLPNVFLAVVPEDKIQALGEHVTECLKAEWKKIADTVWSHCQAAELTQDEGAIQEKAREKRFFAQVDRALDISWQGQKWPASIEEALDQVADAPSRSPMHSAKVNTEAVKKMAEELLPKDHRDDRYYSDKDKTQLNNVGMAWACMLTHQNWIMDAVRQTHAFQATDHYGSSSDNEVNKRGSAANNKDALNGREEAVAGGSEWVKRCQTAKNQPIPWKSLFKHPDWVGATTLIKRVWAHAYLNEQWKLDAKDFFDTIRMPNTRGIAAGDPFAKDKKFEADGEQEESLELSREEDKYFAVLAFDGDEIGKWVSGAKNPCFRSQMSDYTDGSDKNRYGALEYFERPSTADGNKPENSPQNKYEDFLNTPRPLSPSYHLQFSEMLSHFAQKCVPDVVEAYQGRLIYAGGDDVLALLPADTAMDCAKALRAAFHGNPELNEMLRACGQTDTFEFKKDGDQTVQGFMARKDHVDQLGKPIYFPVPGPAVECSVGIAMAHYKSPLQDVVRAAQDAEKRAKSKHGREAVAIDLIKRSGETIQWGCQWKSGGLEAYSGLTKLMGKDIDILSGRYPYRFVQLVQPYEMDPHTARTETQPFDDLEQLTEVLRKEAEVAVDQNAGKNKDSNEIEASFVSPFQTYLENLRKAAEEEKKRAKENDEPPASASQEILRDAMGLHQTAAFASRNQTLKTTSNS